MQGFSKAGRGVGGKGSGGKYGSQYENCEDQGNILVLQEYDIPAGTPNDAAKGGCMFFIFQDYYVNYLEFGLLDIDERGKNASIAVSSNVT
jgi:hypothetical protein